MAEDQGVDGDIWTEEACRLFKKIGWLKIGDSNMDITGSDDKKKGLDALFQYEDGFSSMFYKQGIILEAKHYKTTSFTPAKISEWVLHLEHKVSKLKHSSSLARKYPGVEKLKLDTGVIAIWFHDYQNYEGFKEQFRKSLMGIKMPIGRKEKNINLRVFVLENEMILRTASMIDAVEKFNGQSNSKSKLNFYYPSSAKFGNPAIELPVLN